MNILNFMSDVQQCSIICSLKRRRVKVLSNILQEEE